MALLLESIVRGVGFSIGILLIALLTLLTLLVFELFTGDKE
jgi:hypothetical protein